MDKMINEVIIVFNTTNMFEVMVCATQSKMRYYYITDLEDIPTKINSQYMYTRYTQYITTTTITVSKYNYYYCMIT